MELERHSHRDLIICNVIMVIARTVPPPPPPALLHEPQEGSNTLKDDGVSLISKENVCARVFSIVDCCCEVVYITMCTKKIN